MTLLAKIPPNHLLKVDVAGYWGPEDSGQNGLSQAPKLVLVLSATQFELIGKGVMESVLNGEFNFLIAFPINFGTIGCNWHECSIWDGSLIVRLDFGHETQFFLDAIDHVDRCELIPRLLEMREIHIVSPPIS